MPLSRQPTFELRAWEALEWLLGCSGRNVFEGGQVLDLEELERIIKCLNLLTY